MSAVFRRELGAYFNSMLGYVFISFFLVMIGLYFLTVNLISGVPYFSRALNDGMFVFLIGVPLLSMRSLAEEKAARTDQALLTSPNTVTALILGKYLAMLAMLAIPFAVFCLCPPVIHFFGDWYPRTDYAGIFVFFMIGAVFLSIGMFVSSTTESQMAAAVGTFAIVLLLYLWDDLIAYLPLGELTSLIGLACCFACVSLLVWAVSKSSAMAAGAFAAALLALAGVYFSGSVRFSGLLAKLLGVFSLTAPLRSLINAQVLELRGIILYLSVIFFFLLLTVQNFKRL